jgi:hypothetical protein
MKMIDKATKISKKKNVNSDVSAKNIEQKVEKVIDQNIDQPLKKIVKENYEKNAKKVQAALEKAQETPNVVEDISDCLISMQQRLFAANMAFYTKSLTCYSVNEVINLSQDYFNNIFHCCLSGGEKIGSKLIFNNNLVNEFLSPEN